MHYNLNSHNHKFAIWTTARAVQRGWLPTQTIREAINAAGIIDFAEKCHSVTNQEMFDEMHKEYMERLKKAFEDIGIEASFGRRAKIIAVYLKTRIIMGAKETDVCIQYIHPSIDRILLHTLAEKFGIKRFWEINWTEMKPFEYQEIRNLCSQNSLAFNWSLEKYWNI